MRCYAMFIHHPPPPEQYTREHCRVARPNGHESSSIPNGLVCLLSRESSLPVVGVAADCCFGDCCAGCYREDRHSPAHFGFNAVISGAEVSERGRLSARERRLRQSNSATPVRHTQPIPFRLAGSLSPRHAPSAPLSPSLDDNL